MGAKSIYYLLVFISIVTLNLIAQEMPLVYDVENTCENCPIPYLPSFNELPTIKNLPDPFEWADGRGRIKNFSDWECRRAEIGAQIQNYEIGVKPERPDDITASYSDSILTVKVVVNGRILTLTSKVILPSGTGPFPAVIGMTFFAGSGGTGSLPSDIFTSRDIATIEFVHNQVTTYGNPSSDDPYYKLYPNLNPDNTGQYSAWAWGVSRIIDGLELVQSDLPIDLKHIAVTGCSYAGKMALFSGALDERIALTIAQESGGGGATSWRYSQSEPDGTVEKIDNTDYNWFMNSMNQFSGANVSKMPLDHHELMAMVAPRALYVTANPDYTWLSNPSCDVCSRAAKQVYNTLGISDRFGFSIVGGHGHCAVPSSQIPEIESFVDKFMLGKDTLNTNNISDSPYNINLSPWITWSNPTLSNDTSYFGKTTLIFPPNLQTDLDSTITLKWSKVQDAQIYYMQLSIDPTFKNIVVSDSTSDTLKAINDLSEGKRYYWRIQIKNTSGSLGPWSDFWNFTTAIPLPAMPQLVSAKLYSKTRSDYITFCWKKVKYADQYIIQLTEDQSFSSILKSSTISDTSATLNGTSEGKRYYWRVQAKNIGGSSPWSAAFNFTIILPPTDLFLEKSASNEITLNWSDHSSVEDGYIIERKKSPDTSFIILDTLKESSNVYLDKKVEQAQTYTYRVKAYKDSAASDYSNEASLTLVGVNDIEDIPTEYSLSQNYPNPFNPITNINYQICKNSYVTIKIFDVLGREIKTLVNKQLSPGNYSVIFDGSNFPSGFYLCQLRAGNFTSTKKIDLLK